MDGQYVGGFTSHDGRRGVLVESGRCGRISRESIGGGCLAEDGAADPNLWECVNLRKISKMNYLFWPVLS